MKQSFTLFTYGCQHFTVTHVDNDCHYILYTSLLYTYQKEIRSKVHYFYIYLKYMLTGIQQLTSCKKDVRYSSKRIWFGGWMLQDCIRRCFPSSVGHMNTLYRFLRSSQDFGFGAAVIWMLFVRQNKKKWDKPPSCPYYFCCDVHPSIYETWKKTFLIPTESKRLHFMCLLCNCSRDGAKLWWTSAFWLKICCTRYSWGYFESDIFDDAFCKSLLRLTRCYFF